jgi:ankyrin repeat protein
MSTVSRRLPAQPHLDVPKREARELLKNWRAAEPTALDRIRRHHPRFEHADAATIAAAPFKLADAQLVLAREYNFASWPELKRRIELNDTSRALERAIRANDRAIVRAFLQAHPHLLHIPVRSGNWGPPMSYAANLGRLEIIQDCAELGARDFDHAFDRAVLQSQLECARWLHDHGAKIAPGTVMGPCETLSATGLRFLVELSAPLSDNKGNRLAPLALILETYGRNPDGKHACLEILARQGYVYPDTPIMAFHRGRLDLLRRHLQRDPSLIDRRFEYREIYPPELGCADDGRSGLHGTWIGGTTFLHLAIDFDEQETFEWLLAHGADVNARAEIDSDGFGGHTPIFNSIVSCAVTNGRQQDAAMTRALLARGAAPAVRATLRKFLDWVEEPRWHVARDVTPLEWARDFPERGWVNAEAVRLISEAAEPA